MNTVKRNELIRNAYGKSAMPAAAIAKCGVCVAFVALFAWIGAGPGEDAAVASAGRAPEGGAAAAVVGDRAAAHRKQVFDERRARFDGFTSANVAIASLPGGHADFVAP
jgi:hypothetical protein